MLNQDRFDSNLMLSHEEAERKRERTPDFKRGFSQGYWHQPAQEPENDEYMEGYHDGWNAKVLDGN